MFLAKPPVCCAPLHLGTLISLELSVRNDRAGKHHLNLGVQSSSHIQTYACLRVFCELLVPTGHCDLLVVKDSEASALQPDGPPRETETPIPGAEAGTAVRSSSLDTDFPRLDSSQKLWIGS